MQNNNQLIAELLHDANICWSRSDINMVDANNIKQNLIEAYASPIPIQAINGLVTADHFRLFITDGSLDKLMQRNVHQLTSNKDAVDGWWRKLHVALKLPGILFGAVMLIVGILGQPTIMKVYHSIIDATNNEKVDGE